MLVIHLFFLQLCFQSNTVLNLISVSRKKNMKKIGYSCQERTCIIDYLCTCLLPQKCAWICMNSSIKADLSQPNCKSYKGSLQYCICLTSKWCYHHFTAASDYTLASLNLGCKIPHHVFQYSVIISSGMYVCMSKQFLLCGSHV